MAEVLKFSVGTWMFGEDGELLRGDAFEKAMNQHYSDKYGGLSRPLIGAEVFDLSEPRWALENLIQEDGITMVHGSPGSGKSLMAMDWAYVLAHPNLTSWMGQERSRQFKPMYIFTEGIAGLRIRSQAWQEHYGEEVPDGEDGVLWVRDAVRMNRSDDPKEPWGAQMAALFEMFNDYKRDILFVDTLANTFSGNENSQQDANNYLAAIRMFVNAGVPVIIVHHNTKEGKDFRGSTVFEGAVDTKVAIEENNGRVHLYITKQKDGDPGFSLDMRIKPYTWQGGQREYTSVALEENRGVVKVTRKQQEILTIIEGLGAKATTTNVAVERQASLESTANMLDRMASALLVRKESDDTWSVILETPEEL